MLEITIEKPTDEQVREMQSCPVWESPCDTFPWEYAEEETCYVTEGEVEVATEYGEVLRFGAGDLVTFPKGLKCVWEVRKPVRKHYRFG